MRNQDGAIPNNTKSIVNEVIILCHKKSSHTSMKKGKIIEVLQYCRLALFWCLRHKKRLFL